MLGMPRATWGYYFVKLRATSFSCKLLSRGLLLELWWLYILDDCAQRSLLLLLLLRGIPVTSGWGSYRCKE